MKIFPAKKKDLQKLCKDRGIKFRPNEQKDSLIDKLNFDVGFEIARINDLKCSWFTSAFFVHYLPAKYNVKLDRKEQHTWRDHV